MVLCISVYKIILTSLNIVVEGFAWRDWPFTWWTDQLLSFSAMTLLAGVTLKRTDTEHPGTTGTAW